MKQVQTRCGMTVLASAIMLLCLNDFAAAEARTVAAGAKWEVAQKTALSALTIGAGATVSATSGRTLTMTVNGVETAVKAGSYSGNIVLTPALDINVPYDGMGTKQVYKYRVAALIDNGVYAAEQSVAAAVASGTVTGSEAKNVKITSRGEAFNGIVVKGNTTYTITKPVIDMAGNGKNDFEGIGAGIKAAGSSKVTINHPIIKSKGAVRTSIWVGDNSVTTINNADIEVDDGVLPATYGWSWVKGGGGTSGDVMMEVPWMLGLRGNNRATMAVGNANVTYNHSHIKAHTWGAMSTDAVQEVKLYLNKSHIETVKHGYGTYADGNSLVTSSGSKFDVADYGVILSGGSALLTDGTVINSRRFGIMGHGGNSGTLTINKGSVVNAAKAAIQLKNSSPTILIDNAKLTSKTGLLLQVMAGDDPNRGGGGAPGGPGGPSGAGEPGGAPGGGAPEGAAAAMLAAASGKYSSNDGDNNVDATIKNSTLQGDFLNSTAEKVGMKLRFENVKLTGAISTATAVHLQAASGEKIHPADTTEQYYLIGEQTETPAATEGKDGAQVTLDSRSAWTVSKTSYLSGLTLAAGATVAAPKGKTLTFTVDGVSKPLTAGSYSGKIVLAVK